VTGTCGNAAPVDAYLTVKSIPSIAFHPTSRTICSGTDNVQFSVSVAEEDPSLAYQWQYRELDNAVWGALPAGLIGNTSILTILSPTAADHAGFYRCQITSDCGIVNSTSAQLVVEPIVEITPPSVSETNKTSCEESSVTFTVDVTGPSDMQLQWYKDGGALANTSRINGVNLKTLTINNLDNSDAGDYYCMITSTCGILPTSTYNLTVHERITIIQQPKGGSFCPGGSINLIVSASGTAQYQWQEWDGTTWINISGANSNTYIANSEGRYRCQITNVCQTINTDGVQVVVAEATTATSITVSPANPICEGQNVSLSVNASGTNLSYAWYKGGSLVSNSTRIGGSGSSTLTINGLVPTDHGTYQVEVNGTCGSREVDVFLEVQEKITITGPASTSVLLNGTATFSIMADGYVISYQWYHKASSSSVWVELVGEVNPTLTIPNADFDDTGTYKCIVTGGVCDVVESKTATLTVLTERLIQTHPVTPITICEGSGFTLSVGTFTPVNSYQWYRNDEAISGATSYSLTINPANPSHSGAYTCLVVKDGIEDRSSASNVTVNPTTTITVNPTGATKCEGDSHLFSVTATGKDPLAYEWYHTDTNGNVSLVGNSPEYNIPSLNSSHRGTYHCEVTSASGCGGTRTSSSASLNINLLPAAAGSITGLSTVCQGASSVQYSVPQIANATSYVWDVPYGATIVSGNGTNSILVDYSAIAQSDEISVFGRNGCGDGSESSQNITVNPIPVATAGADQWLCDASAVLSGNNVSGGKWSIVSGDAIIENVNQHNSNVNFLKSGTNTFRWTVTQNGCSAYDDVNITNLKIDLNAGPDQVICSNETNFSATSAPLNASWSVVTGQGQGIIENPTSPTSKVSQLSQGNNVFVWQVNNNGCISSDQVTIRNDRPLTPDAGPDVIIAADTYQLQAKSLEIGTSGKWSVKSGGGSFVDDTQPTTIVNNLMPGSNILVWTVTRGNCTLSDEVTINNITMDPADAGSDQTLCVNSTTLNAAIPNFGTGEWTWILGGGDFENKNDPKTKVTNLQPGTNVLRWTVRTSLVTDNYDEVNIINNMPTTANAGFDRAICGDVVNLAANSPVHTGETGTWSRISGAGTIANVNSPSTQITGLAPGKNEFKWTIDNNGCLSEDFVVITNDTPTTADAGEDAVICSNSYTLLPNTPTFGVGSWSTGGNGGGTINGNEVTQLMPGLNTFVYTIQQGNCSSSDEVDITNNKPTTPNAGSNRSVCINSYTLDANRAEEGVGTWSRISGTGIIANADLNNEKANVTNLSFGQNTFRWTIQKEDCVESALVTITYDYIEAFAGINETICENIYQLNASNPLPGTGTWSILANSTAQFDNHNDPSTIARNLTKGPNKLLWTVTNNNCVDTASVTITNNRPSTPNAGVDRSVCGKSLTLNATAPSYGSGMWSAMSGAANFVDDDVTNPKATIENLAEGPNVLRWTITQGECTLYDEVTITSNYPENVSAGEDHIVCSDQYTFAANPITIPGGTGNWRIVPGMGAGSFIDRTIPNATVTNLGQGENWFIWTVSSADCQVSDTVVITSSIPTTAVAASVSPLCKDWTDLVANEVNAAVESGYWELVSGSVEFDPPTSNRTRAINIRRGTNKVAWVINRNGCLSTSEVTLINNSPSTPRIFDVNNDNNQICADSVRLYAEASLIGQGRWSTFGEGKIISPNNNVTKVEGLPYGPNTFFWTITNTVSGNTCTLTDTIVITSNLAFVDAGDDLSVNTSSATLIGNVPNVGTGSWRLVSGSQVTEIVTPNNFTTLVRNLTPGVNVFSWNINYNGCISSDLVSVSYSEWPIVDFKASVLSGCPPLTVTFENETVGQGAPYTWYLDKDTKIVQQQSTIINHIYTIPGQYVVKLEASVLGEDTTVTKERVITVHPTPKASFSIAPEVVFIPGQTISCYNYSKDIQSSIWSFGDGRDFVEIFAPTYLYQDTGKFDITLKVINQFGCPDSLTIIDAVHVRQRTEFFFPEAFTPNPFGSSGGIYDALDRSNDVFYPILAEGEILDYELRVFNRAGVMVFRSNDINIGWDGYYKNKMLPQGVYIYSVTGRYNNGEPFKQVGNVLLIVKDN
jgi:hypothetical protein